MLLLAVTIIVRLADVVGVPSSIRETARAEVDRILESAGVESRWVECVGAEHERPRCRQPLEPAELVVRLAPRGAGERGVLGMAVVDTVRGSGTLATVWFEAVRTMATVAGIDVGRLMGRAIAHEIGHLLLGTSTHPQQGLMRAQWTVAELHRDDERDWAFAVDERITIVQQVEKRTPIGPQSRRVQPD